MKRIVTSVSLLSLALAGAACTGELPIDESEELGVEEAELFGPTEPEPGPSSPGSPPECKGDEKPEISFPKEHVGWDRMKARIGQMDCQTWQVTVEKQVGNTWEAQDKGKSLALVPVTGLSANTKYCFRGKRMKGNTALYSPTICPTTESKVTPPKILSLESTTSKAFLKFVDQSGNEEGFKVMRTNEFGNWVQVNQFAAATGTGLERIVLDPLTTDHAACYKVVSFLNASLGESQIQCTVRKNGQNALMARTWWHDSVENQKGILSNSDNGKCLVHDGDASGVNLGWIGCGDAARVTFRRAAKNTGAPLMYGELIGIYVQDGGYLHNSSQSVGAPLDFSSAPQYEWKILSNDADDIGLPVRNEKVALYNVKKNWYLIETDQWPGTDIGFGEVEASKITVRSDGRLQKGEEVSLELIKTPANAWWKRGSKASGEVTRIHLQHHTGVPAVFFLKDYPGTTTSADCSKATSGDVPGLGVHVQSGADFTAAQRSILFGSANPQGEVYLIGCPMSQSNVNLLPDALKVDVDTILPY